MHYNESSLMLSPTNLSDYLGCHHLIHQDLLAVKGETERPSRYGPVTEVMRRLGLEHEAAYKQHLIDKGRTVIDAEGSDTLKLMRAGVDVLFQARLEDDNWAGIADFLFRTDTPSELGNWSYEALDTKLAQETRGGTILQLCAYSLFLSRLQGRMPRQMHVVTPGNDYVPITYRVADYTAYFRRMRFALVGFVESPAETYPDRVSHCDICVWWKECEKRRRADDHLCYVAGLGRGQIQELALQDITRLTGFAEAKKISRPARGSLGSLLDAKKQAQIQLLGRRERKPKHEVREPFDENHGFALLPEPTPDDIYVDLEGNHFAGDGVQEYLIGYVVAGPQGEPEYTPLWAETHEQERRAFEAFIDLATETRKSNPEAHIYHFSQYEPAAFKRLMGRYATRATELDELLRGKALVDLHKILKCSLIASVESYSLKNLEDHYGFSRDQDLRQASISRRIVEACIEDGRTTGTPEEAEELKEHREIVENYNRDDCVSMQRLQDWLEGLRKEAVAQGHSISRPELPKPEAPEKIGELDEKLGELRDTLLKGLPVTEEGRTQEDSAKYILAHTLEFYRREDKAGWWEKFRLLGLDADELEHERRAISGLEFVETLKEGRSPVDRYTFSPEELDVRNGDDVFNHTNGSRIGKVVKVNHGERTLDIQKTGKAASEHPRGIVFHKRVSTEVLQNSLVRLAESIIAQGFSDQPPYKAAINLLLASSPTSPLAVEGETMLEAACRLVTQSSGEVIAIQGPPGTGKTHTGGHMICACRQAGLKVGVTAVSHQVIGNLLEKACSVAAENYNMDLSVVHRREGEYEGNWGITYTKNDRKILKGLENQEIDVVGATAWRWAREDHQEAVDVLFVDEAGQVALGHALATAHAGTTLVLLGDPQQLEQPMQASHPEGTDISALEHFLDGEQTMPKDRGLFLEKTWRLHPVIARFTSEVYYEERLSSVPGLENQAIVGSEHCSGSGLRYVPVEHAGNTSRSAEEAAVIQGIVKELLLGARYRSKDSEENDIEAENILIMAPYNAQVSLLSERLPELADRIGTVDRFQGREAAVVIYSMTSSSPEDAPRGMGFLYDPHRLNVATSRARALCILVGSPNLLEPECKTPEQMKMANGLCRYMEICRGDDIENGL